MKMLESSYFSIPIVEYGDILDFFIAHRHTLLPQCLLLQLNRTQDVKDKIFKFYNKLDLTQLSGHSTESESDAHYELKAFIVLTGGYGFAHYFVILNLDNSWYRLDDETAQLIDAFYVNEYWHNAYVLLYTPVH